MPPWELPPSQWARHILHDYEDIFKGVGTLPGGPYHTKLKDSCKPVQHPLRSVPLGKQSAYKAELDRLVKDSKMMQFKSTDCKFFGHRLTPEGIKVDPKKIEAIIQMDPPQNFASLI